MKLCRTCNQSKPIDEMTKDKSVKSGISNFCKKCSSERSKVYHEKKRREDGCKIYQKYDLETKRIKHNESCSRYARQNPDRVARAVKESRRKNPDVYSALKAKRRCLEKGVEGQFSASDVGSIYLKQGGKCAACKVNLKENYHIDHIKAISKGGTNWPRNIQILCKTCNVRKHAMPNEIFMRRNFGLLL